MIVIFYLLLVLPTKNLTLNCTVIFSIVAFCKKGNDGRIKIKHRTPNPRSLLDNRDWKIGTNVTIISDSEQEPQDEQDKTKGHNGVDDYIGKTGRIDKIDNNDVSVRIGKKSHIWNPSMLGIVTSNCREFFVTENNDPE